MVAQVGSMRERVLSVAQKAPPRRDVQATKQGDLFEDALGWT